MSTPERDLIVGGQAVMEGVMMRTPNAYAIAVRKPDGTIVNTAARLPKWSDKFPILKLPVLRGGAVLVQSMGLGIKALNYSASEAFVELEEGIDGLVHVSDITWAKKLKHPKELLKKDQEVDAIVTNIDPRGQRLSLSMKDLTPSAWEGFVATHRPGDTVRGKVTRFTSFGVFVELGEGLEGLCHISELADERVEKPEDVVQLGQEMDFKILRIENDDQKIGLSARAVGKGDEPVVDSRQFSTEAKGGMASLGELANLILVRLAAALLGLDRVLQQNAGRRALHLEAEGAVLIHRHQHAHDLALEGGGGGVELLDELPRVHAVLAERRPDRGRRRRGAAGGLELELDGDFFLGHDSSLDP
jgi:predicted RNA-binding protein with RPS1 domain